MEELTETSKKPLTQIKLKISCCVKFDEKKCNIEGGKDSSSFLTFDYI